MDEAPMMKRKDLSIDEMIPYIGEFAKFQWVLGAMFSVMMLPTASQSLIMYFASLNPTWRCIENSTLCTHNGTFPPTNDLRCSLPRSEWEFTEEKQYSIVTYFDIYCGNAWLINLSSSIVFVGSGVGSLVTGWIADNYGRRTTIYLSTSAIILVSFLASFMPNIYLVICLRFITGFFLMGAYQSSILLSEIVANNKRPLAATLIWCFFPVSLCLLGVKAYFFRSWKLLFIVCSAPYSFIILFYFFTPESPRWLRLHGEMAELMQTFTRIAKFNGNVIPPDVTISPASNAERHTKTNPLDLFRTRNIVLLTINVGYAGIVNAMTYYGLSLVAADFGGSLYVNFILISLTEIPAGILCIISCARFGRKSTTIISLFIAGVACAFLVFLDVEIQTVRIIVAMIGKLFVTTSYDSVFLWMIELYPTSFRSQAASFFNILSTIGSSSAPWMVTGLRRLHISAPYIFMSLAAITSSAFCLFLGETKGLPTLECGEDSIEPVGHELYPILGEETLATSD